MELRDVDELMDLLHACRGAWGTPNDEHHPVDLHEHALQTAALLRRSHPSDKELQLAGLLQAIGQVLPSPDPPGHAERAADAVRPLLGARVAALIRLHAQPPGTGFADSPAAEDAATLRQAVAGARVAGLNAGIMEDWRPVLELVADAAHGGTAPGPARASLTDRVGARR
ncbi:HD domain-containing protein [Streptomyces sp. O3]